jgi:MFS family permease
MSAIITNTGKLSKRGTKKLPKSKSTLDAEKKKRRAQVFAVCTHFGLNVGAIVTVLTARATVLSQVLGGNPLKSAKMLAYLSSGVGLIEFIINPIVGKLSDAFGRKMFIAQAPAFSILLKLLVFFKPSLSTIALERCLGGATTTLGGSTTCSSALADIVDDPQELGQAYALFGTAAGLGVMIGPLFGAFMNRTLGRLLGTGAKTAYLAGAVVSAVQLGLSITQIEESLDVKDRSPMRITNFSSLLQAINPLGFLQLFSNGKTLATLVTVGALQCFCEGKCISDLNQTYMMQQLKLPADRRALYVTGFGIAMTLSGYFGKETIKNIGMRGHTTLSNFCTALGFSIVARIPAISTMFGVLPLYAFAMERRAAISSLSVNAAAQSGMGKGDYTANFANFRAIVVALAPMIYAQTYSAGVRSGTPGMPYYLGAIFALMAELLHRTLNGKTISALTQFKM